MDKTPLYQQIAEAVRQEILYGELAPGDSLPSVRLMAKRWDCTPGTVQQAYKELAGQGLTVSQPGQGTRVVSGLPAVGQAQTEQREALRRAGLINQAERFLLEVLTAGYSPAEIERALRVALDRWRSLSSEIPTPHLGVLRFAGSHDPAISLIAGRFGEIAPGYALQINFSGSLGGLMALARGETDLAGCHLWDAESDTYNLPFVRRLLPGSEVVLLTLAHRRLGLIVPPGNPAGLAGLADLVRPALRFVNRQRGAGTRVWLDAQLGRLGLSGSQIMGYDEEVTTHSAVAQVVAEGRADAGLGVEAAARAFGLSFLSLTTERYDLAMLASTWQMEPFQALARWLAGDAGRQAVADLGGYEVEEAGAVTQAEPFVA